MGQTIENGLSPCLSLNKRMKDYNTMENAESFHFV